MGLNGSYRSGSLAPNMSPTAVKKLIETRNERFRRAVEEHVLFRIWQLFICVNVISNRLISAASEIEDSVNLIITAGLTYVPVNTSKAPKKSNKSETTTPVPAGQRASMDQIISKLSSSTWYKNQIVCHRSVKAKDAQTC